MNENKIYVVNGHIFYTREEAIEYMRSLRERDETIDLSKS